ncbi:MAG: PQQ-dependent sugar dehydrogenase, partial [Pseudomonadota bacterium]
MLRYLLLCLITVPAVAGAQSFDTSAGRVTIERIAQGFDTPWSLAFLPDDGGVLVTERDGALLHVAADGSRTGITGLPDVYSRNQGGLFDVVVARDFADTGAIFLSYAEDWGRTEGTTLAVATLNLDAKRLEGLTPVFRMTTESSGGRHFGGRIAEATDGTLFLTLGDRADRPDAQASTVHNGKLIRINRDGSVPDDNPFVNGQHLPEVWSTGHRNPQGLAFDPDGGLWTNSHGASGGDEVNLIEPGRNYGWPVISFGRHYSGGKIGDGTSKAGMEQPKWYWDPSIAPSGLAIYSGRLWPEWEGDHFIGSLKYDLISRLDRDGS